MAAAYDVIVLGTGGVGSAACWQLAKRGARVLGLDRFPAGHDRGSSHGRTRIIRQAYFEHPDYVPLLLRAYQLWAELEAESGQSLLHEVGLLQVGPPEGLVVPNVLRSAALHHLSVDRLAAGELRRAFPQFAVEDGWQGAFEQRAGLLLVEDCVRAMLDQAARHGAALRTDQTIVRWTVAEKEVQVETTTDVFRAPRLVIAAGAWSAELLHGLQIPLTVRRQPQFWFPSHDPRYQASHGCPTFLFETPSGVYYGFPDLLGWGVKVACHSRGEAVADPLAVDRRMHSADVADAARFLECCLPGVERRPSEHAVCLYTMSPDENFLVDRHPAAAEVCFAAGLSGHGFKFTSVLGAALADLALEGQTALPIAFLSARRFANGALGS
ncbi:MAG TPA: N-methyl-L-tryptophan oxidase [Pirellulales bacterium]|jgi:monomeric sarcosine oxidase|nr:N-methyl-L-tryptophan oxidase [Pirellulales bacterium]